MSKLLSDIFPEESILGILARSLYLLSEDLHDKPVPKEVIEAWEQNTSVQIEYGRQAAYVLRKLRCPSDAMLLAVWPEGLGSMGAKERLRLKADWMKMIDAALAEAPDGTR